MAEEGFWVTVTVSELEVNRLWIAALLSRGQELTVQMGAEGSIGIPTYKQIIMQKQRQQAKEGVRISGNDRLKQSSGKNKEKTQVEENEPSSNTIIKGK